MTLAAGSKLGPYEVVAPIGAGGMNTRLLKKGLAPARSNALNLLGKILDSCRRGNYLQFRSIVSLRGDRMPWAKSTGVNLCTLNFSRRLQLEV